MKARDLKQEIVDLIGQGKTNPEIAAKLDISKNSVAVFTQRELGGNPNYLKRKIKHKHLHRKVLTAKLAMNDLELMEKFNLSASELKSCLTSAYKREEFAHIRKDKRRRDAWSSEEYKFMLKYSGIISQDEISQQLKRGKGRRVVKEKMQQLGLSSKYINGLTLSKFYALFKKAPIYYLETTAGPPCSKFSKRSHFKIVPWCHIREMLIDGYVEQCEVFQVYIDAMAMFQRWIHGSDYWRSLVNNPKQQQKQY